MLHGSSSVEKKWTKKTVFIPRHTAQYTKRVGKDEILKEK